MEKIIKKIMERIEVISLSISVLALIVAVCTWYTANRIALNASPLKYEYSKIEVDKPKNGEAKTVTLNSVGRVGGQAKLNIGLNIESGQISSLYLVEKQDSEFKFKLLNKDDALARNSKKSDKVFNVETDFDMKEVGTIDNIKMGTGNIYMLAEEIEGAISVDIIQIAGPIIEEQESENKINLQSNGLDYNFRYLKNNKIITIEDNSKDDDGWVELEDKYPEELKTIDLEQTKSDIQEIVTEYRKYKY